MTVQLFSVWIKFKYFRIIRKWQEGALAGVVKAIIIAFLMCVQGSILRIRISIIGCWAEFVHSLLWQPWEVFLSSKTNI